MAAVTQKTEVTPIDGTPEKRMFWSIINDYDFKTGLCELVDNALDLWTENERKKPLVITLRLDPDRQLISVGDNAGGVRQNELRLLLAPGGSRNDPSAELIGIFGVGGKRAGIALGEQVQIRTRYHKESTYELDITHDWLQSTEWQLPVYEVPDIEPGTTRVDISHLRKPFVQDDVDKIAIHLGETYNWFLQKGCTIKVNGKSVGGRAFSKWAYPPKFAPRSASFKIDLGEEGSVAVTIVSGLIRDRVPEEDNYGVYFYCNHRLIVKELRAREVGYFVTSEAGVPHPDASLCRAIVRMQGPAKLMPWNSSKSGINFDHPIFKQLRPTLIQLVSHFSSLSRRLKADWPGKVFEYDSGSIEKIDEKDITARGRLILPPLPRVHKTRVEHLKTRNKKIIHDQPWTLGLVEAMGAVEVITRQRFETKNRIALIVLDSNFEIGLKEFIIHREDLFPRSQFGNAAIQRLFSNRGDVIRAVAQNIAIPQGLLNKAQHYYEMRNKLIHERATVAITDSDIDNYRSTVGKIMKILFGLRL